MLLRITKIKAMPLFHKDDDPGHQERPTYRISNKIIYMGNSTQGYCKHSGIMSDVLLQADVIAPATVASMPCL
jgi:hypothetical protein